MARNTKTNIESWKSRKRHTVTLQSGAVVEIEIPNLPLLIKTGRIPNHLIEVAVKAQTATRITKEDVEDQYEFYRQLVALTVVEPELTADDVDSLPFEDVEMLVEFATRARDIDAVGHHLGGLETVDSFRDLRGL
jgi:hypothetical protein